MLTTGSNEMHGESGQPGDGSSSASKGARDGGLSAASTTALDEAKIRESKDANRQGP